MSPPDGNPLSRISATRRFDPWNSSATGHQRAETQPGTGWRHSRTRKLNSQFGAGDGSGGKRLSDTWGAGAEDAGDGSNNKKSSVMDMLTRPGLMRQTLESNQPKQANARDSRNGEFPQGDASLTAEERLMQRRRLEDEEKQRQAQESPRKLFDGVTVYVNGSTFPLVSDHRLKQLISENGGNMSLNLGRRKVTHVILGRPNGSTEGKGLGGGLAAGKLEKEIRKIGGCGVKFVSVEWVLQSLQEGRRLPEARFSDVKMAAKAQNSVYGLYTKHDAGSRST
ncbi:hypothetical protein BBK36DRAFT_1194878 [Trichoderma citrinoviride]|uniref:BRCT domain-containing protein n=1 Tax=Trichoderma citrinoviride TaxID=58853 RepID=A0A2T4BFQ6_9HYPO|nr:hypothetical protein BBK36DRAFT_1194878 [Trichoderma citrinoviride]PTB68091.1 hypothetical protein BBK36DRAFT_1194878 [Trichoderma citrinoviride]